MFPVKILPVRSNLFSTTLAVALLVAAGCDGGSTQTGSGGSTTSSNTAGQAGSGGQGQGGSGGFTTGSGASDSTGSTSTSGSGGSTSTSTTGTGAGGGSALLDVGSLVILGDSISDGGGDGPYYYNLLHTDLEAKYGALEYHHQAQSGSKTDALVMQINSLPSTLTGPVAVVITSGGNDMKAAIAQILGGIDESKRNEMRQNVKNALDLLGTPNHFGPGVDVHVFEGNIYDSSDGSGKYSDYGCKFPLSLFPAQPTDTYFTNWNTVIAEEVAAHGQTLVDMHTYFYGHGFQSNPNWYVDDCIHPSTVGHSELRNLFYEHITGETL
ncbi:MAG: SGNH/GDSL hydrolase family protein [Polyangiaceae bacterium]|nr:SGNH/GDSL hydrolase family protein [Polyangiaceae bacterium]